jgi:hypothetical protein
MTHNDPPLGDYLTPAEVCLIAPGLTILGLAQLRSRGRGPVYLKPTPRTVLYRRADVIAWLENSESSQVGERAA